MPSELEAAALRHRSQLLRQEREAASAMVEAYGQAWQRVRRRLDEVLQQIDEARAQGLIVDTFTPRQPGGPVVARTPGTFSPAWLFERDRLQALLAQIEAELRQFAQLADGAILAQQQAAVQAAQANSAALLDRAARAAGRPELVGAFDRLPRSTVEDLVGFTSDGSPLRRLLDGLGPQVGDGVRHALTTAVATGIGPRETARLVRRQFGMGLKRALTIARTEQLRAYREAARRTYEQNADVLEGWTWLSGGDGRTCPSCLAMHGTVHPVTEGLDSHPNCRCTMVPKVKGVEGPEIRTGEELFAELPEAQQRRMLGPAAFEAYQAGAVRLADFVGVKDDPVWGRHRYVKSLRQVVGREEARKLVSKVQSDAGVRRYYEKPDGTKVMGFTFYDASVHGAQPSVGKALAFGRRKEDGWATNEQVFKTEYLPRHHLRDDVKRTLGLWGAPEPSFNAWVKGSRRNIIALGKEWGRAYNQEAMALLLPNAEGTGGALSWDFGRKLTVRELDRVLGGVQQVNRLLREQREAGHTTAIFEIGLTVLGRRRLEFWVGTDEQREMGSLWVVQALTAAGINVPSHRWEGGYDFRLLFRNEDY